MNDEAKLTKRLLYWQKVCDLLMLLHHFSTLFICTSPPAYNTNVSHADTTVRGPDRARQKATESLLRTMVCASKRSRNNASPQDSLAATYAPAMYASNTFTLKHQPVV